MDQILVLLVAFVAFAVAFLRLGLGSVLGYLAAGMLIGPSGANLIIDVHVVEVVAELGVVFLLFTLGLEIKLDRLRLFGLRAYILAVMQLFLTTGLFALLASHSGAPVGTAIAIGGALALSSTAIVLQILTDTGRTLTLLGRTAIAVLLVQDLAVGPLLIGVKVIGSGGVVGWSLVLLLVEGVAVVAAIGLAARYALPPVLRIVARLDKPEVFMAVTLFVALASSWATQEVGVSAALGAFVAGLVVADSEFRHQIAADIAPLRGLFVGLFFMTVGIKTELSFAFHHPLQVAAITFGLVVVKMLLLMGGALALRYRLRVAVPLGVLLAQGSEFSFVVLGVMATTGLLPKGIADLVILAVALSMLVTPLIVALGRQSFERLTGQTVSPLAEIDAGTAERHNHIVIVGFGQVGMALTRHLLSLGIPVLVIDYDPQRVRVSRRRGLPVFFGNAMRSDVLRAAHVGQAHMVVVATPGVIAVRVVELVRRLYPKVPVVARAADSAGAALLQKAGAGMVALDGLTTAIDLAERVVTLYSVEDEPAAPAAPQDLPAQDSQAIDPPPQQTAVPPL